MLPSNVAAVETAMHFATGVHTLAAIVGPSGWGKSHILECVAERLGQRYRSAPRVVSAAEWVDDLRMDGVQPLLLDDLQEVSRRPRSRIQLRIALERRVRTGRPTMLAYDGVKSTRQLRAILPRAKEWAIGLIAEPAPSERALVLAQLAEVEGLSLSPALTHVVAHHMRGDGRTLTGALRRLRLSGSLWNDVGGTLKACGLLEPFFADCGDWDLRGHILAAARRFDSGPIPTADLVAYTMLREAAIGEVDVARAMRIEPGEAYSRCTRFERLYKTSEEAMAIVQKFLETIVGGLSTQ